jgi:hypothetical protein
LWYFLLLFSFCGHWRGLRLFFYSQYEKKSSTRNCVL